jgi:hypothetical protein
MYLHDAYYPPKIYITENGWTYDDPPVTNGVVDDLKRRAYFQYHLDVVNRAIEADVPVAGYFAWSLMDNFEWAEGYLFALWSVSCRFCDPAAHAQNERALLSGAHRAGTRINCILQGV